MRARVSLLACLVVSVVAMALPASASAQAPPQRGLVNINVSDLTVQVPLTVAANICDVNVAVLVNDLIDDSAACTARGDADATVTPSNGGGAAPQDGLVNVNVSDVTVQVPVAVAANVCDVNVAVLVGLLLDDAASCDAEASSRARN